MRAATICVRAIESRLDVRMHRHESISDSILRDRIAQVRFAFTPSTGICAAAAAGIVRAVAVHRAGGGGEACGQEKSFCNNKLNHVWK